jgi:hypothetical protein
MMHGVLKLGVFAFAAILLTSPTIAQTPEASPRTPEGRPDLQGVWANQWLTPLEKPARTPQLIATPEEERTIVGQLRARAKQFADIANDPEAGDPDAHGLTRVRGEYRTRMIVAPEDGLLPLTPEGQKAVSAQLSWFGQRVLQGRGDGPEDRLTWERCLAGMGQAPLLFGWAVAGFRRIVQTPDALVIHSEAGGETRVIRIGGAHLPAAMPSYLGDSIGRWEGETLVVETRGFKQEDQFRMSVSGKPIPVAPGAKVTERFTRVSPDELNYQFTVEDPATYSKPWLAEYSMARSTAPMFEFACHEGNYGLANILSGARERERKASLTP